MSRLCGLLGHKGDWSRTHARDGAWVGVCKRCEAPVVREVGGNGWDPAPAGSPRAAPAG